MARKQASSLEQKSSGCELGGRYVHPTVSDWLCVCSRIQKKFVGYMPVCMIQHEILMHAYLEKLCKAEYRVVYYNHNCVDFGEC